MKKKILAIVLSVLCLMMILPAAAFAGNFSITAVTPGSSATIVKGATQRFNFTCSESIEEGGWYYDIGCSTSIVTVTGGPLSEGENSFYLDVTGVNAGNTKVSFDVYDAVGSWVVHSFELNIKVVYAVTSDDVTFNSPSNLAFDGNSKAASFSGKTGMGTITPKYATSISSEEWSVVAPVDAGTYYVKACIESGTSYDAAELKDESWKFTIDKKEINVTADAKSSYVGSELEVLTYTADDLVTGDSFSGALATDADKNTAGDYDITQGTLAIDDGNGGNNYTITFTKGTYSVKENLVVNTGDNTNMRLYIMIAVLALGAMGATVFMRRKADR